ncbi:nuclear polyadenylated RNA-binding protein 3 [Lithohypha guttulata]|uniref:nuclear polyadenylated RNA-binding protein 3 n=1 Tax=Lithohypha guttulata TaxID=1690604 RepID=UPI002DE0FC6E|nr:nuclear polyadenylated RNA-binding protein 3 [Lithohypha guttulata]
MSSDGPPVEQQRFARTQTPESPRPVHLPEPAKIPVLLNQMDPSSNDLATYNIPADQNFAHYGDTLENPAYKSSTDRNATDPFHDFLRNADSAVANQIHSTPTHPVPTNPSYNVSIQYTNHPGSSFPNGQVTPNANATDGMQQQQLNDAQPAYSTQTHPALTTEYDNTNTEYVPNGGTLEAGLEKEMDHLSEENKAAPAESGETKPDTGVDYQSLLDTIAQSASTAPSSDTITAPVTDAIAPDVHPSSLPSFPGLPPKPPPLEDQAATSVSVDVTQAQQPFSAANESTYEQAQANGFSTDANLVNSSIHQPGNGSVLPTPGHLFDIDVPVQQPSALDMQYHPQNTQPAVLSPIDPADRPWSPKTQAIYDQFLEDERHYVTEGIWDRFPMGSRLFVGNLPSEKVTKRDLFHKFHRHGKLAQISIKQAYGFVQYHDAQSCKAALDAEQGVELRGRKVHLEVSKPQKNTKNAGQQNNKSQNQNQSRRRSRSPQRRPYSDFRDDPGRRREVYRNRSPSPRGYRRNSRDDRRSPLSNGTYNTPQPAAYDDEASLPYPRRDPRYVPDVQIIVLDAGVNQAFVNWIEDSFRRKGLTAASTWLNTRTPLAAVIKRQIMEGVQAVVKVGSSHQTRSKVPLQVFDRSAGTSNITFNEYVDLDVSVAADVVIQARQRERVMTQPRPPFPPALIPPQSPYQHSSPNTPWAPQPPYPLPQQHPAPQHYTYPPQPYRPPPYPTPQSATSQPPNLHELLANLKGGAGAPPTPQSAHSASQPFTPYGQPPPPPPQYYGQNLYPQPHQQQGGPGQQSVQNIMDQLARYQR